MEIFIHQNQWPNFYEETVIVEGGAGFCHLSIYPDEPNIGYLNSVSVFEGRRREGIGTRVLQAAVVRAISLKLHELRLTALADGFTSQWYERHGFQRVSEDNGYVRMSMKL